MAKLSRSDEAFLDLHGIPLTATFDASGMRAAAWKQAMRDQGKLIAYGVSCLRGHSLKTRAGNCVRCNTANIAYALRPSKPGYVYIAHSKALGLVKIGFSQDPDNRVYIANLEGYGGAADWAIKVQHYATSAGRIELELHSLLHSHKDPRYWYRNGDLIEAREVYSCSASFAQRTLRSLVASPG